MAQKPSDNKPKKKKINFDPKSFSVSGVGKKRPGQRKSFDPENAAAKADSSGTPQGLGYLMEEGGVVQRELITDLINQEDEAGQSVRHSEVDQTLVDDRDMLAAIAEQTGLERVALREVDVDEDLLKALNPALVKKYRVFPVSDTDDELVVALADPNNVGVLDDLQIVVNKEVRGVLASSIEVEHYIEQYYEEDEIGKVYDDFQREHGGDVFGLDSGKYEIIDLDKQDGDEPAPVRYVDLVFAQAVHDGASDIHVEPVKGGLAIRFRVDGVLREIPSPPPSWQNSILSRLKVMSSMDLAEKRVPQDGRIKLNVPGKVLDLRVNSLPSIYGETIVMRILDQSDVQMGLEDVGFLPDSIEKFEKLIRSPNGIILMTGPTGSGKTTTLNSALNTLNSPESKIITVEDPVEYQMQGINQLQVNTEAGLTFATALRAMLRMSPDVIMVGEIRDMETGEIAIRAALTGHLVFSTLHTNDAPSATIRLIDMGIKPFLVASSIQAVIAQRLIRRICGNCKTEMAVPQDALIEVGVDPDKYRDATVFKGVGCDRCNGTGYRGRTAIHEIFTMTPEIRKMVIRSESNIRIKKAAVASGMRTLRQDGWEKVLLGQTTIEEVMRITQMD